MRKPNVEKIRLLLLVGAVFMIGLGICQQGHLDLLNKAIRICYECIGIG